MAVVKLKARGRGVYRKMREKAHQIGRESGFERVIGESSSAATQHLCINKFSHQVHAEIHYGTFTYKGQKPFAKINEPPSIMLAAGHLLLT